MSKDSSKGHYAWNTNYSAFMADVKTAKGKLLHWCKKCSGHFQSENVYDLHKRYCLGLESCGHGFMMPESRKLSQLYFRN